MSKNPNSVSKGGQSATTAMQNLFDLYSTGALTQQQMYSLMQGQPAKAAQGTLVLPMIPFCERAWRAMEPDQAIELWHGFKRVMRKSGGYTWAYKNDAWEQSIAAVEVYVLSLVNAKNANPPKP